MDLLEQRLPNGLVAAAGGGVVGGLLVAAVRPGRARRVVACKPGDDGEPVLAISLAAEAPWRPEASRG